MRRLRVDATLATRFGTRAIVRIAFAIGVGGQHIDYVLTGKLDGVPGVEPWDEGGDIPQGPGELVSLYGIHEHPHPLAAASEIKR